MANWSFSCYKCVGDSKELEELYNIIKNCDNEREDEDYIYYDEVIKGMGLNPEDFDNCGTISSYYIDEDILEINHRARYCAHIGFMGAIKKKFPNIKVYFCDYEYMMEVYRTNSFTFFPTKYIRWDSEYGSDGWSNLADAATACEGIVGYAVKPTVDAISKAYAEYNSREGEDLRYSFEEIFEENE